MAFWTMHLFWSLNTSRNLVTDFHVVMCTTADGILLAEQHRVFSASDVDSELLLAVEVDLSWRYAS